MTIGTELEWTLLGLLMEFVIGGTAASVAVFFTNPLEVIKTRFQLQGELRAKGHYPVYYRNVLHAFYIIAKTDGIAALQGGLAPALAYQIVLNGTRLGLFQVAEERKWLKDPQGQTSLLKSIGFSTLAGGFGGFISSPFYLIKVHSQARANESIAVGYQHEHRGLLNALGNIYKEFGLKGLFRGATAGIIRISIASVTQLPTFTLCKEYLRAHQVFSTTGSGFVDSFVSAMVGGVVVAIFMTPFDVVSTRFYNQGVDATGKGITYKNLLDCMMKCFRKEGMSGLYKGFVPCYFRIGPYNLLTLVCWDGLKTLQKQYIPSTRLKST